MNPVPALAISPAPRLNQERHAATYEVADPVFTDNLFHSAVAAREAGELRKKSEVVFVRFLSAENSMITKLSLFVCAHIAVIAALIPLMR